MNNHVHSYTVYLELNSTFIPCVYIPSYNFTWYNKNKYININTTNFIR